MLCEGCLSDEGTCAPTSGSVWGPNPMYTQTPIRKQTLLSFKSASLFFKRKCFNLVYWLLLYIVYIIIIPMPLYSILFIIYCRFVLYCWKILRCWMTGILFYNWVFLIGKFVDTCVRFISTFVRFVRKLGCGRDICLFKIHLVTTCAYNFFSISAYE